MHRVLVAVRHKAAVKELNHSARITDAEKGVECQRHTLKADATLVGAHRMREECGETLEEAAIGLGELAARFELEHRARRQCTRLPGHMADEGTMSERPEEAERERVDPKAAGAGFALRVLFPLLGEHLVERRTIVVFVVAAGVVSLGGSRNLEQMLQIVEQTCVQLLWTERGGLRSVEESDQCAEGVGSARFIGAGGCQLREHHAAEVREKVDAGHRRKVLQDLLCEWQTRHTGSGGRTNAAAAAAAAGGGEDVAQALLWRVERALEAEVDNELVLGLGTRLQCRDLLRRRDGRGERERDLERMPSEERIGVTRRPQRLQAVGHRSASGA
mmetsp:Transcript_5884/g.18011  ORF Transcript_5884/g.18011 Transcript_5884/m.18011 type:complete len:331 (+) Transcript_5884:3079-4071(+)